MDIPRPPKKKHARNLLIGLAVVVVAGLTWGLSRLEPAAPSLDAAMVWTDTVKRGQMLRQVRGSGHLVPENIVYITAATSGRVEEVLVAPGATVEPRTILLRMSNPDVELDALEAQRQLTVAEGELIALRGQLETGVLNQQATVTRTRNEHRDAVRRLAAYREVPQEVSKIAIEQAEDRVSELKALLEIHERSLELLEQSRAISIAAKESQVERLGQIVDFQRRRFDSLQVRAGTRGVVRELPVQVGQHMGFGQSMGVIIQPGRLKAQVRLHEAQARDIMLGQPAEVDTRPRVLRGQVARIDPAAVAGMVTVDVTLDEELPQGVYAGQSVDAVVLIERLDDVLYLARPSQSAAGQSIGLFKVVENGNAAVRVTLRFGRSSVDRIEIERGAEVGDEIILTDMSRYDAYDRVRIKR